jgi:hypothetical protein
MANGSSNDLDDEVLSIVQLDKQMAQTKHFQTK